MKKIAVFIILLACASEVFSQQPFFQNYFLQKKNENVYVNTLYQDKNGFIWFGTAKGLFRFDGTEFERYSVSDSTPGNVTAIAEDSIGRIWVGQKNGVIGFLENGRWKKWESAEGPIHQTISKILFDKKGTLWFAVPNEGLYYYRNERLNLVDDTNGMPDLFVYDIAEDARGQIWAGTDGGVAICTLADTVNSVSIRVMDYKHGGLPDNIIKKLRIEKNGIVWMVTDNAGVINYDPSTDKIKPLSTGVWKFGAISDFLLADNEVWIASSTGIIVNTIASGHTKIYNAADIPGITTVNAILRDHEGNIWTGSRSGVLRTLGDYIEYIDTEISTGEPSVSAVAVDSSGSIWWASTKGLFRRRTLASGQTIVENQLQKTPYEKFTITTLYFDHQGFLWVGFYGEGVLRINPSTGKIRSLRTELRNGNVLNISGKGNNVWLATLEGAVNINIKDEELQLQNFGSSEGLSSDYIYQVFMDSQDRVWLATDGKGVDMMDSKGTHHFQEGLKSQIIYGFAEDANHTLWANVAGEGLYQLDGNRFKPLDPGKALRENSISCLAADQNGNIVVMHDLGIDLYEVKRKRMHYLGDEVGIRDKIPNLNATAKDGQGRIYFGTGGGIVTYSDLGQQMLPEPLARIERLKVLDKDVALTNVLNMAYNKNYVTISYLGLWYQNPENLFYQTKLEHYDRDWISSRDLNVTYSSLPPGDYIFHLRVSNTADFSSAQEVSMKIVVDPPFWQRWWFFVLIAFFVFIVGYAIIQYREKSLLEDKRILEMKVTERTLEIQRKTEEIQAQNEEIHSQAEEIKGINENLELLVKERTLELIKKNKALEEYAFITAHNLRAPVASVLGLISLASMIELDEEHKVIISHLQTSAEKLDSIVRSITVAIEKGD